MEGDIICPQCGTSSVMFEMVPPRDIKSTNSSSGQVVEQKSTASETSMAGIEAGMEEIVRKV